MSYADAPPVPAAHTDERVQRDRAQQQRNRQVTFERGVALALVVGMQHSLQHLRSLKEGLRWVLRDDEAGDLDRWLVNLQEDILRGERIESREGL